MADVAEHAGVSRPLVSMVIRGVGGASETTRARILQSAAELGYRPDSLAQGLRRNHSRNLGVLFSLRRPFEVELVEHLYPMARELGYDLLLGPLGSGRSQDDVIDELLRYRCAGVIVVGPDLHAADLESLATEVAVVEIGRGVTPGRVDVVRNDDAIGTRQAVDHLASLGHRAIAFVDGGDNPGADRRRDGYRQAMVDQDLTDHVRIVAGGYTEDDGARAGAVLLDEGLPTAVIASNDLCAIGVLDVVLRAGISVPEDLSVIGYDDSRFGRLPGIDLTSVRQDIPREAKLAMKAIAKRLENPERKPRDTTVAPRLVIRGTTAAPRAEGPVDRRSL